MHMYEYLLVLHIFVVAQRQLVILVRVLNARHKNRATINPNGSENQNTGAVGI